jgi:transcriptional regulator with XRE-family HTH domain
MIGNRLKEFRVAIGLSVSKFASQIGAKDYKIRDCESGKQRFDDELLTAIANKFDINLTWLVTGKGNMMSSEISENSTKVLPENITILNKKAIELNPDGLQNCLVDFIIENSVKQKLRSYDKSINFAKYMFWDRYDTVASYRLMKFLLKKIQKDVDLENVTMENSKQILKKALEEYNLGIISFLKDALQKKDREHTIKLIESLDDWDAYCILKDINLAIDAFEDAITWLAFKLPLLKLKNEI